MERLPCAHKGTYADDCICERVKQHRCYIVATCDRDLRRRIRKVGGNRGKGPLPGDLPCVWGVCLVCVYVGGPGEACAQCFKELAWGVSCRRGFFDGAWVAPPPTHESFVCCGLRARGCCFEDASACIWLGTARDWQ